jgi:naphthalene 1,2-dioxygenase ferredoxin component
MNWQREKQWRRSCGNNKAPWTDKFAATGAAPDGPVRPGRHRGLNQETVNRVTDSEHWITVADRSAVPPDSVLGVKAGELDVALYNIEGQIYATHNICTHAQALLSDGWLDGDVIECPLHGGRFEVKTGKGLGAPITCDLKILPVRIEGDAIQVNVSG